MSSRITLEQIRRRIPPPWSDRVPRGFGVCGELSLVGGYTYSTETRTEVEEWQAVLVEDDEGCDGYYEVAVILDEISYFTAFDFVPVVSFFSPEEVPLLKCYDYWYTPPLWSEDVQTLSLVTSGSYSVECPENYDSDSELTLEEAQAWCENHEVCGGDYPGQTPCEIDFDPVAEDVDLVIWGCSAGTWQEEWLGDGIDPCDASTHPPIPEDDPNYIGRYWSLD